MNTPESESAQSYPLSNEEIRRKRIKRDKQFLTMEMNAVLYDRGELLGEYHKAQQIFVRKLEGYTKRADAILQREKDLLKKVNKLLELDGKCSATSPTLLNLNPDKEHRFHSCKLAHPHGNKHHCDCGSKFSVTVQVGE